MEPYQERVIEEKKGLDEKIEKLSTFLLDPKFWDLTADQRSLLRSQLGVMQQYTSILDRRIDLF